jgi:glycosyltransferase involved in cell wall biosynthesis
MTVTIHDLRSLHLAHSPFSRRFFARSILGAAVQRASRVYTVSETVRSALVEGFHLPPYKVVLVPNAADHFTPLPHTPGPGAPMLHVGHLEARKNIGLLIEALALDPGLPDLLLAGAAKGSEGARLAALAEKRGVSGRVRFHGHFEDGELPALLALSSCVVLPSLLEGFGIAALEAQRARVPLAIAETAALVEVAGTDVPRFPADDAAACARAIRAALAASPVDVEGWARNAERYSWDRSAQAWAG